MIYRNPRMSIACFVILLCGAMFAPRAHAWSSKEHIQLTRIAAERLIADPSTPAAMKAWLRQQVQGLTDTDGEKEYLLHKHIGAFPKEFTGILGYATRPDDHAFQDPQGVKIAVFN